MPRQDEKKELKVIFIVTSFPRSKGEVLNPWIIKLIEVLNERKVRVDILTSTYKGRKSEYYEGIRVERFRYLFASLEKLSHDMSIPERLKSNRAYYLLLPFFLLGGAIFSFIYGLKHDYDIIHVHFPFPLALFGLAMKSVRKRSMIYSCHGSDVNLARTNNFYRFIFKKLLAPADGVIVNSSFLGGRVMEIARGAHVTIIPMGGSTHVTRDPEKARQAKDTVGILFVGRLIEWKGIPYLLEGMKMLVEKRGPRFSLHIVGDGPERGKYEKSAEKLGIKPVVQFKGYLKGQELEKEYESADIFVLPSIVDSRGFTEGLGTVLLEAIESGLVVIGSRVGGIPDIVKHRETGLLVEPKDSEGLAEAILMLADDEGLRERLAKNAKNYIERDFSWEEIGNKYERIYRDLVGGS